MDGSFRYSPIGVLLARLIVGFSGALMFRCALLILQVTLRVDWMLARVVGLSLVIVGAMMVLYSIVGD